MVRPYEGRPAGPGAGVPAACRRLVSGVVLAAGILASAASGAQTPTPPVPDAQAMAAGATKSVRAVRATSEISVDGVLDDAAWNDAEVISDLVQQEPKVDQPVSERTEIRVLFDDHALYFGVFCHDSRPHGVTARELRRDNSFNGDDRFEILLDTFHDHRNGYHFVVNPLGAQYDAQITDEGRDINSEWDERWESATKITEQGWTAEIMIPLTTIRAPKDADVFGVNFLRFIRNKNETAMWTGWGRDYLFLQVGNAGQLTGLRGIETGLNVRIKPYVLGGAKRANRPDSERVGDVGLEVVKFGIGSGLTAELTVNTDFAQTEVDEAVVNLTRFPVFFPEKREFFLERAGIFEFGPGGRRGGTTERNLQMFFSRRIGLTDDRRPVPIIGGGKLTGQAGGFDVGVLNVQTDSFEGKPGSNYTVVRTKRNVFARSNVGGFYSQRQASGSDFNRVGGADANLTFGSVDIGGFAGKSWTSGVTGNSNAGRAKIDWYKDLWEVFAEYLYIGDQFQHDVGYIRRRGIQRSNALAVWEPRPKALNIRNLVMRAEVVFTNDLKGALLTREEMTQFTSRWQSDDVVRVNSTRTMDRLERPFNIASGVTVPVGEYTFRDTWGEVEGSGKRPVSGRVRVGGGDFYDGTRHYVQLAPNFRPFSRFSFESTYEFNDVSLREGDFTTHVFNGRVNVNLSSRLLTTTLAQYDSASDTKLVFFRLNYIYRGGDDLFVVFNRSTDRSTRGGPANYTFLVKLTRSFDF